MSDDKQQWPYLERLHRGNLHERACAVALEYGTIDGEHHKQWVIDQMVRILAGMSYGEFVAECESVAGYTWDEGIAP